MSTAARTAALLFSVAIALSPACGRSDEERAAAVPAQEDLTREHAIGPGPAFQPDDLYAVRSVDDVQLSPDGAHVAYAVRLPPQPGRPPSQVLIMDVATGHSLRFGPEGNVASGLRWSPDGQRLAYFGLQRKDAGIYVSRPDGSQAEFVAPVGWTNDPLPSSGERLAWSPDGTRVAFVSATSGPETEGANDPTVITRYLYKPTTGPNFNDNRRLHIFIADVGSKQVRQLTSGTYYEHSIAWSPRGDQILFISNRGPSPDRAFNYDIFTVRVADGSIKRLTDTPSAEYDAVWSPDGRRIAYSGTKRPLTSSETTMEDTHVWTMDADGTNRREVGAGLDNRQGAPRWSADGRAVYFTVQERGSERVWRVPAGGGDAEVVLPAATGGAASVRAWSIANNDVLAASVATPGSPAELCLKLPGADARQVTAVNKEFLAKRSLAPVEAFTFKSFDGTPIEAFLTRPAVQATKAPLIVIMHGGPHGQQGPTFNAKAQIYAAHGYAVLMVNYRGSTGYGQKFADAIFNDQDGGEARDVLAGVDAALAKYPWLDANRMGIEGVSYGGQLTDWIITQTDRFKAAIPTAGISNLVSFNYMAYYHDYLEVEFGVKPHQMWRPRSSSPPRLLSDFLWERSALREVARVKTPTMFIHGENDNDVPIAEAEQFFIALQDAGVETVMVRYPREGHGLRETGHQVDAIERSFAWYDRHFGAAGTRSVPPK